MKIFKKRLDHLEGRHQLLRDDLESFLEEVSPEKETWQTDLTLSIGVVTSIVFYEKDGMSPAGLYSGDRYIPTVPCLMTTDDLIKLVRYVVNIRQMNS